MCWTRWIMLRNEIIFCNRRRIGIIEPYHLDSRKMNEVKESWLVVGVGYIACYDRTIWNLPYTLYKRLLGLKSELFSFHGDFFFILRGKQKWETVHILLPTFLLLLSYVKLLSWRFQSSGHKFKNINSKVLSWKLFYCPFKNSLFESLVPSTRAFSIQSSQLTHKTEPSISSSFILKN